MTPAIHPVILMAAWVTHANRDHAAGIPLAECQYSRQSPAFQTYVAVYARLDDKSQCARPASGRIDVRQVAP